MHKNLVFGVLTICGFLECLSKSIIAPFFPPFALSKNISNTVIGIIIACNPIGSFFSSLILGKIMNKNNRYVFMLGGLVIQSIGTYMFGLTEYIDDAYIIVVVSIAARIVSGVGVQAFMTPYYSLVPLLYPDNVEFTIGLAEMVTGGGFMLGPVFGSLLYSIGGYTLPFWVFGTATLIVAPLAYLMIKDTQIGETKPLTHSENLLLQAEEPLGYLKVLSIYAVSIICLSIFTSNVLFTFCSPTMADFLHRAYDLGEDKDGYVIAIASLAYVVTCIPVSQIKRYKLFHIFYATGFLGVSFIFLGPDKKFTGLDNNLTVTIISWVVVGYTASFLWILCMPLMNEILVKRFPRQQETAANLSSALMNAAISMGDLIGPILGGVFGDLLGFERGCAIMGFYALLNFVLIVPIFCQKYEGDKHKVKLTLEDNTSDSKTLLTN